MSGHSAQHSIPRGDRDEPYQPISDTDGVAVVARLPQGLDADIAALQLAIDDAQMALGELKLARSQANPALATSAAWRLTEALMIDPFTIATRVRRTVLAERRQPQADAA